MKKKIIIGVIVSIIIAIVTIICILKNSELKIVKTGAISQENTNYKNIQNCNDIANESTIKMNDANEQEVEKNTNTTKKLQENKIIENTNIINKEETEQNTNVTKKEEATNTSKILPTGTTTYYIKVNYQANAVKTC